MDPSEPSTAQAKKPQCIKDWAMAGATAAAVAGSVVKAGGGTTKWESGSQAAKNTPPQANRVHSPMDSQRKLVISGVSRLPIFAFPARLIAIPMAIKKVANSRA